MLTKLFIALSLSAAPGSSPAPSTPDEFLDSLQAPVAFENIRPIVELRDGIHLELSYELPEVGPISIGLHTDDGGSGLGLVTVGETVVAELRLAEGSVASETADFSALSPAQAHAVAASLMQVWREDAVTEAFMVATVDDRAKKCWLAGWMAGKVAAVLTAGACGVVAGPLAAGCGAPAALADVAVKGYVSNKCNQAQNK